MTARELAGALGLNIQFRARKYSDAQPRAPAGSGRASGQWASGDAGAGDPPVVEGRSAISGRRAAVGGVNHVNDLPKDAIVVTRPNGPAVEDPDSTTGKLMAPPRANFQEIYAAGKEISKLPRWRQFQLARAALRHFGTYDFQRDEATNTFFKEYSNASNYAVGVYMAGAGYGRWQSVRIAQSYGFLFSSTKYERTAREWTEKGWDDATRGDWR